MIKGYKVEGLSCAMCAEAIREEIGKREDLQDASLQFDLGIIRIRPEDYAEVQGIIDDIEPGARIIDPEEEERPEAEAKNPLLRILASALLFAIGVAFNSRIAPLANGWGLYLVLVPSFLLAGWPVLQGAIRNLITGRLLDELFLMSFASIGALLIGEPHEAAGVMIFYAVGEALQERALSKSRTAIRSLMKLRPDTVRLMVDGKSRTVDPEGVAPGALIEVRPGETVPLDGVVEAGESAFDTSALTGESVPRAVYPGGEAAAGFINEGGRLLIRTTKFFGESSVAKIIAVTEHAAERKAKTERLMTRIARVYTPLIMIAALLTALIPPLFFDAALIEWIHRALVITVISCPCALVISIPLAYFAGIGASSQNGILVKGAEVFDRLKNLERVVFDKTGTLTKGEFRLLKFLPADGVEEIELLRLAAGAEAYSTHPIAGAIRTAHAERSDEAPPEPTEFAEIKGSGIRAYLEGRLILVGTARFLTEEGVALPEAAVPGQAVYLAADGSYQGGLLIDDEPRPEGAASLAALRRSGVRRIEMLSGDEPERAAKTAESLGLDGYRAGLRPEEKLDALEGMMHASPGLTAFVGDGINDAPVIMRADVGIAMGGVGSDAAVEAADLVVMDDSLSRIPTAIKIARATRRIVWQNILFAAGFKLLFIVLGAAGSIGMGPAVVADVGVALVAVLNASRLLRMRFA